MHGPVDGEVSRSSRIPPSIAATLARPVRPADFYFNIFAYALRAEADEVRATHPESTGAVGDVRPAGSPAFPRAQGRASLGVRGPGGALVPRPRAGLRSEPTGRRVDRFHDQPGLGGPG